MSIALMAPRKNKRSEASMAIAKAILEEYQPFSVKEMQDALRDVFCPMFEAMLQGELDDLSDMKQIITVIKLLTIAGTCMQKDLELHNGRRRDQNTHGS